MSPTSVAAPDTTLTPGTRTRFVVVSGYYPPIVGGTSTVMRQLLDAFDPAAFDVIAETPESIGGSHNEVPSGDIRVTRTGIPGIFNRLPYVNRYASQLRYRWTPVIRRHILQAIRRTDAQCIVAVYPSWPFLHAAWQAHQLTGLPLYPYYMDITIDHPQMSPLYLDALHTLEAPILGGSATALCLSDAVAHDLHSRYGVQTAVIPHAIDLSPPPPADIQARLPFTLGDRRLIVHTGVVEYLQATSLKRILAAMRTRPEMNACLVLSTPTPRAELEAEGFVGPDVCILSLTRPEVRALQRAADIALAVLPFETSRTGLQDTSFPTKSVEYMHSGVPILAHVPPDSFFARHISQYGYANLATDTELSDIAAKIFSLLNDPDLRKALQQAGRKTIHDVFELGTVARRFASACSLSETTLKPAYRTACE